MPLPDVYRFAWQILDFLAAKGCSLTVAHWAEIRLLKLLGVAPQVADCVACGKALPKAGSAVGFSVPRGGLLCRECQPVSAQGILPLSDDVLAMLRTWQETPSPTIALRTACTTDQHASLDRLLGAFVDYHLESSRARRIALDLL